MKASIRRLGNDESHDSVSKLRIEAFPAFREVYDIEFYEALHRWYMTHPMAEEMYHWVAVTEEERVVGHLAALPQFYRVGGKRVVAHTPADYMVLPGYSFQSFALMRAFFRATENCVACDMVPAVISIETRLGAEVAGEMQYAAKLLNVSRLPMPPIPGPLGRLLRLSPRPSPARGYGTPSGPEEQDVPPSPHPRLPMPASVRSLFNRALHGADEILGRSYGGGFKVDELDGFDASFDDFSEKIAGTIPCVPEKDAAFLGWRYGPESPQWPVKVLGVTSGGGLVGYAVLKVASGGQDGYVFDLTTLPGQRDVARALLRESVRYFRRKGVQIIRYRYLESPTSLSGSDLRRLGFFSRRGRRTSLLVKFADENSHRLAQYLGNWSYNVGDSEATFWIR